jgi:hypothetical protein
VPDGVADGATQDQVSADLDQLVRRLRLLSPRSWKNYREPVQEALAALVAIASRREGRELAVPDLPDHVLPDALAVIGHDLLDSVDPAITAAVADQIHEALNATR